MPAIDLTGEDWENLFVPGVLGGQVLNKDSEAMQANQFLTLDGLVYQDNIMRKDTGYITFADIPSGVPGLFRRAFKHISATGVTNTFGISNLSFYVLANSGANWHIVSNGGGATTTDVNVNGGDVIIPVTATTNFAANDIVGVRMDDGSDHVSTIASVSAGVSITLDDAVPGSGVQITSGNVVTEGILLAGTADKQVFALTIPWNDWLAFTNGIDTPKYYDPSTTQVQVIPNLPSGGDTLCESLALFDASLVLLRTTEGGTNFNQRIRWSDKADATNWTTGDSGSVDLLDSADRIQNGLILGPYLVVYREKSIYRGTAVNTTTKRFQWDSMVTASGAMSSGGIVDIGDKHLVIGNKQVYIYGGGFDTLPVGDSIKSLLFGPQAEIDIATVHRTFAVYIEARNDVLIFYQTTTGTFPNKSLRWFGDLNVWAARSFDDQFVGIGEATKSNSLTWNDLVDTWEDQTWNWNSTSILGDLETILLCGDDGQVYEYNFLAADDAGIAKVYTIETPDFSHSNGVLRQDYIEFKCSGTSVKLEYSTDAGASWNTIETFSPGTTIAKFRSFKQISSRTIRYRLSGSNNFSLAWISIRVTLETEY